MGGPRQRGQTDKARSVKELRKELAVKDQQRLSSSSSSSSSSSPWTPPAHSALKLLLAARLSAAVWSGVSDCDETFNYWEPSHHLLYGQGLQTWEYEPRFALRSYLYLQLHLLPARLYTALLQPNPMMVFYFLRCLLALLCSLAEVKIFPCFIENIENIRRRRSISTAEFSASSEPTWADCVLPCWPPAPGCSSRAPPSCPPPPPCTSLSSPWAPGSSTTTSWPSSSQPPPLSSVRKC